MNEFGGRGALIRHTDARVYQGVNHINNDVDQHDHQSDEEGGALHHSEVLLQDCLDVFLADAEPGEDGLGDDGAAEQIAEHQSSMSPPGSRRCAETCRMTTSRSLMPLERAVSTKS